MYDVQVRVETMDVSEWLDRFCAPEKFLPLCKQCPEYGKNWSCPAGVPDIREIAADYRMVQIIGIKIIYDEKTRTQSMQGPDIEETLRQKSYGIAKKQMQQVLLELEKLVPGSLVVMAGRCELCERCARMDRQACRHPEWMRYSFSGLGFDLVRIAEEVLHIPLLWQNGGLPEYNVAVAAFLHP